MSSLKYKRAGDIDADRIPNVVLLHGFGGSSDDLLPFASSLGVSARFFFPQGPVEGMNDGRRGFAWWNVDEAARDRARKSQRARDLSTWRPSNLEAVRFAVSEFVDEIDRPLPNRPIIIGGFSQGAILALDVALTSAREFAGVFFASGSAILAPEWDRQLLLKRKLNVVMTHGEHDTDLSCAGAEALRDRLLRAGHNVRWRSFEGGHEMPLMAWRELKTMIREATQKD